VKPRRFQVSTRATGHLRVCKVVVFDNAAQMRAHTYRYLRADFPGEYDQAAGITLYRQNWADKDPRPFQATIYLNRDDLTLTLIAHEATHAAMHFYSIDGYRNNARASAHLTGDNEQVAHAMSELFSGIVWHFDTHVTPIGEGVDYEPVIS
jgi:hypothetical protein